MTRVSAVEYAAARGGGFVAYRTCGDGPPDVLLISDWFSHVGDLWRPESPFLPVLERIAGFSRLITFDKRGVGMSDPVPLQTLPTLEEWIDDLRSVLDAIGSERATIIGKGSGGAVGALFAATHPERTAGLVLVNAWARLGWDEDFPLGVPPEAQELMLVNPYMPSDSVRRLAGERINAETEAWWQSYVRDAASPSTSLTMRRWLFSVDVRSALPTIGCPTVVIARRDAWIGSEHARYLADRIPDARLVELPGAADFLFTGDTDAILYEIEEQVTGTRPSPPPDRVLATVLYTDLVGSTAEMSRLGDRRWSRLLDQHDRIVRTALAAGSGQEVKTTGDGFLAMFDGPARALRAAAAIRDGVKPLGLEVRAGLHAGLVELREGDIGGIATHIGARIQAMAAPGQVLVSRTVRDLVVGSGIGFRDCGVFELKGIPDEWQIYELAD